MSPAANKIVFKETLIFLLSVILAFCLAYNFFKLPYSDSTRYRVSYYLAVFSVWIYPVYIVARFILWARQLFVKEEKEL